MKTWRPALALLPVLLLMGQPLADPADPTIPALPLDNPGQAAALQGDWELHSTLVSAARRGAVINGQSVREGERIGAARVVRILAGEVLLDTPERRIHLRLLPDPLRIHTQE